MKKLISFFLTATLLFSMMSTALQVQAAETTGSETASVTSSFIDGVYTLAVAADGDSSEYGDGTTRRVLDMAVPDSNESLLQLNTYTGENSQEFIIRQYSKNTSYYMIQSVNNQGYLGYSDWVNKKVSVKKYGQLDDNAEEYLWKPISNDDGSWSFAPMNAYTVAEEIKSKWNLRLGVADTGKNSVGSTAVLVATDDNSNLQKWFLQSRNILDGNDDKAFQIATSKDISSKTYVTSNIGGSARGAWDMLPLNLHEKRSIPDTSQKFVFERTKPSALQTYQQSDDYKKAVAISGGGYYRIREVSNSQYVTVEDVDGVDKLRLRKSSTDDAGLWTVFPNYSQNNQSETAIADSYSLVSCKNGKYYSISVDLAENDFLSPQNTDDKIEAREYTSDENVYRQYWRLYEENRNPGTITDGDTNLQQCNFNDGYISLPIEILDFDSDNMLFEFDNSWTNKSYDSLLVGSDNWIKSFNKEFSLNTANNNSSTGLVKESLNGDLPEYSQAAVVYLAGILQTKLAIPYKDSNGNINNNYLSGEPNERYGTNADGSNKDFAQWLRDNIGKTNDSFNLGDYALTDAKRANLVAKWTTASKNIDTCMDVAYFMLNSIFVNGSYNEQQSDYKYLKLGKAVDSNGNSCYVFDSDFADANGNSSVVYEGNAIYNSAADKKPLYDGKEKYPFLPITDKNNEKGMTRYESPLYGALRSLEQYGDTYYCRNYSYALSSKGIFTYSQADNQFFSFSGNDDAYLFINGKLVMDIGGTHDTITKSINLNDYASTLGLNNGEDYSINFYYMQRMGSQANLRIATNIKIEQKFNFTNNVYNAKGELVNDKDNTTYSFVLSRKDNQPLSNTERTYKNSSGKEIIGNAETDGSMKFELKGGESANFTGLIDKDEYKITEVDVPYYVQKTECNFGNFESNGITFTSDAGISQSVEFKNYLYSVDVSLKYYGRETVGGKPAGINQSEYTYTYSFIGAECFNANQTQKAISKLIVDTGAGFPGELHKNSLEEYHNWTTQEEYTDGIVNFDNLHKPNGDGTYQEYESTPYHTNWYGYTQVEGSDGRYYWTDGENGEAKTPVADGQHEKWVMYRNADGSVIEEIDGNVATVADVSVWLFNQPRQYTVKAHQAQSDSDITKVGETGKYVANDSNINTIKSYYNQRLGEKIDGEADYSEATAHLNGYNIKGYTGTKLNTKSSIGDLKFAYWALDANGDTVISTDILFNYRITNDIELYAVYTSDGKADNGNIGLSVTMNSPDIYFNANGEPITRLYTLMNPYNCPNRDSKIENVAVLYVVPEANTEITDISNIKATLETKLPKLDTTGSQSGSITLNTDNAKKATCFIYYVDGFDLDGNGKISLTNKNRIEFSNNFKTSSLKNKNMYAFAAMYYNGTTPGWKVSGNCINYKFDANGKLL